MPFRMFVIVLLSPWHTLCVSHIGFFPVYCSIPIAAILLCTSTSSGPVRQCTTRASLKNDATLMLCPRKEKHLIKNSTTPGESHCSKSTIFVQKLNFPWQKSYSLTQIWIWKIFCWIGLKKLNGQKLIFWIKNGGWVQCAKRVLRDKKLLSILFLTRKLQFSPSHFTFYDRSWTLLIPPPFLLPFNSPKEFLLKSISRVVVCILVA